MNIFNTDELVDIGFKNNNNLYYLELDNGNEIWFIDGLFYLADMDCPNIDHAIRVYVKTEEDLKRLYYFISEKEL
jgi:hypothetical protein